MEAGGLIAEVGWSELDFSFQGEESEIMAQLLGTFPFSYGGEGDSQELPWSDQASSAYYCDNTGGSSSLAVPSVYEGYYLINSSEALGTSSFGGAPAGDLGLLVQDQGAAEFLNVLSEGVGVVDSSACATNKRKHLAGELDDQARGRKRARKGTKKAKQSGGDDDQSQTDMIPITSGSPTSCCTSDSESNGSQECADVDARPKATKARAARGTATEPQSIYARKRRERINERLKILQNLVPNGTKVDISTMLEEAVHYVKFLQLQIKLLSSDDTWMYAPIAYNGMNIGIDLNMDR